MGKIVYVEFLVNKNENVSKDEELVLLESVKAVANIKAPFDCIIKDINLDTIANSQEWKQFLDIGLSKI